MSNQVVRNDRELYSGSENKYRIQVSHNLVNNVNTVVKFDTIEREDIDGLSYNATTGEFTCTKAGIYAFNVYIRIAANATNERCLLFQINADATSTNKVCWVANTVSDDTKLSMTEILKLAKDDSVFILGFEDSGIDLAVKGADVAATDYSNCKVVKII